MTTITNHYNKFQVYFHSDEVVFDGETFICTPHLGIGILNISPYDSRNWKKKHKSTEEKLVQINHRIAKRESDTSLLRNLLDTKQMDGDFMEACKYEILTRQTN